MLIIFFFLYRINQSIEKNNIPDLFKKSHNKCNFSKKLLY